MNEVFKNSNTDIETYGNVFIASAFLYGLGMNDVSKEKFEYNDNHFQVIVSVKATKSNI